MVPPRFRINLFVLAVLWGLLCSLSNAQLIERQQFDRFSHYQLDDWISYAPASDITSIDVGEEYVYFGSRRGGVLRYHLYDQVWDYPLTTSNGLRSNRIQKISYQFEDNTLYIKTPSGIDAYTVSFGYAQPAALNVLPPQRQPEEEAMQFYRQQSEANCPQLYRPSNREVPGFV